MVDDGVAKRLQQSPIWTGTDIRGAVIQFHDDGSFEAKRVPGSMGSIKEEDEKKAVDLQGTWRLSEDQGEQIIALTFTRNGAEVSYPLGIYHTRREFYLSDRLAGPDDGLTIVYRRLAQ